jgi:hypothetical protein
MGLPSRPLRAMALVLGSWVAARITFVAATTLVPEIDMADAVASSPVSPASRVSSGTVAIIAAPQPVQPPPPVGAKPLPPAIPLQSASDAAADDRPHRLLTTEGQADERTPTASPDRQELQPTGTPLPPLPGIARSDHRLSASLWVLARPGRGAALATGGQLGASQAGIRLNYELWGPVFATARASAPFDGPGRQASVGFGIRRKGAGLLVERWVAADRGGRDDFAVTAYGGVDAIRLPGKARLDAYAQAGIVGRDAFADGAVRVERPAADVGNVKIAVGIGAWAGVQPGVARVDIGPQLVARLPAAGRTVRLSAEWRQRIAGRADPPSGPALTLGLDF